MEKLYKNFKRRRNMKTRIPRKTTQVLLIALLTSSTGLGVSSYVSATTEKNFTSQAQGTAASASTIFDASQRLLPGDDGKVHLPSGTLGNSSVDYSKTTFNDGPITNLQTMSPTGFGADAYTVPAGTTIKYYDTNGILINTWNVDKTINYYKNSGPLPVMACGIGGGHSYPNWFGGTFTPASSSDYTYLTINDIDYGDKVKVKKDQLYGYVIPDDSNLTLTDDGTYLTFTGITKGVPGTLKTASVVLVFNPGSYSLDYYSGIGVGGLVTFDNAKILRIVIDANVTAKYVDTDGNVISDNVIQSGNVGDTYTTEQKSIPGYTFKEVQGSASGTFTDQAQTVTYVYTKDPVAGGDVTAKYVDTDGNAISDNVIQSGSIGDAYKTEQKSIPGYTFKEVQGSVSGTFTDQPQTVEYVYTKDPVKPVAGGDVTVKYVDTDGNVISDNVIQSGNVGDAYTTEQKSIPGYTFKEVQGSATGTFTDQSQTVTYVYTKDPVAGGSVTVKYVDTDGNVISDNVIKSGNIGDAYTTEQKSIPGYTFKEVQGSASGTFTDQSQTVIYVYTKDPVKPVSGGDVTVKYADTDGNVISDNVIKSGNIGDAYTTEQKSIPGYTFKEVQGSASGTFTDQSQTVTYVYTKNPVVGGDVTARYVDTDGNVISEKVIKSGNIGDAYTTEQKSIPGYTFKEVQGSASGTFTDQSQTVTYVYTKDPVAGGSVTVKYVDTDGNVISDNVIKSGNIGDAYTTEQKSIPGYTFKEVQGSASGTFTDQSQTVIYVYTKDPVKPVSGGDVTVKYADTDGNVISDNVIKSGNIGDAYTTEQKSIPGYTFKEVQGSASGTFTDQSQIVTYVYTKIESTVAPTPTDTSKSENPTHPTQEVLPEAGENEKVSNIALVSGIALLGLGAIFSALRYKKKRQS